MTIYACTLIIFLVMLTAAMLWIAADISATLYRGVAYTGRELAEYVPAI